MLLKSFISRRPEEYGGGSNSFARNFFKYARKYGMQMVDRLSDADMAIVIAGRGVTEEELRQASRRGCFIIHRIDEHFGAFKDPVRRSKHEKISALNRHASLTVYQSDFVRRTAQPYLSAGDACVIYNGADPDRFTTPRKPGDEIGHVTWSLLEKKGLADVRNTIVTRADETFRLVGVHDKAHSVGLSFDLPNVILRGERTHAKMPGEYRKMKVLYFPSRFDPCPNTVIEAIMTGVPVCYHDSGGTPELVRDCGEPLERFDYLLNDLETYRQRCAQRSDLEFPKVIAQYRELYQRPGVV